MAENKSTAETPSTPRKSLAKFNVGQVVCMKSGKQLPFRILEVIYDETGIFYKWNRRNAMDEKSVRALTDQEKGSLGVSAVKIS